MKEIEYTLIIREKNGRDNHYIERTIYLPFLPTVGMELKIDCGTKKSRWVVTNENSVFVQITNITCYLDRQNKRVKKPIQVYAAMDPDRFPNGLDNLEKWWWYLNDGMTQTTAHAISNDDSERWLR